MLSTPSTPISLNVSNILSPNYSNLTGSARKIKDRKTMMVNAIEKWKGCQLKGMEFIQKIADNLPKTNEISLKERHILESYASELHKIINSMETVVDETENISSLMASTLKLELNSLSPGSQDRCAVSRTCEKFEKLSKMLEKDFEVKKSVVCKVCSYPDWSAMKVLSSLWINDNFVDKKLILEFYKMADKSV